MPHIRRALRKYALPLGVAGVLCAPALGAGAPATFAPAVDYALPFMPASQYGVADLNGDGHLDVAVGSYSDNEFAVFPGTSDGTLGTPGYTTVMDPNVGQSYPFRANVADLNNDGKMDLAFAGQGYNASDIIINQSSGGIFSSNAPLASLADLVDAPQAPAEAVPGDLNGDGKLDLVQTGFNGGACPNGDPGIPADAVTIRLGNGNGTFGAASQAFTDVNAIACHGSNGAAIADVNEDGHLDVLALSSWESAAAHNGSFLVGIGDGTGALQQPAPRVATGVNADPKRIIVADLNGDSHDDVVTVSLSGMSAMLGNGDGTFGSPYIDASMQGYGVAVGDVNGDGINDVAVANYPADSVQVALGNGDGTFGTPDSIPFPAGSHPFGIAMVDLGSDGLQDLVMGTYSTNTISVLINTTAASAPTITSVTPSIGSTDGGTSVTITGTNLATTTAVSFGGTAATSFTVNSASSITATAPAHAAGTVSVDVTTAGGTGTSAGLFTYEAAAAPVVPPAEPASSGTSSPTENAVAPGKLKTRAPRVVGRTVITTGLVPAGADRIVQTAVRGAVGTARFPFALQSATRISVPCAIAKTGTSRTFACKVRLETGNWLLTTRGLAGDTTLASSTVRVRIAPRARLAVTG